MELLRALQLGDAIDPILIVLLVLVVVALAGVAYLALRPPPPPPPSRGVGGAILGYVVTAFSGGVL